jgi:mono/diheme cytochrome c family protein
MRTLITLSLIAAAASASADSPLFTSRAAIGSLSGEQIYNHICQGCHMSGAQGAVASWEFVALTVLNGRNGMPPFGLPVNRESSRATHLTDAQIADVVNYVRSHFENQYKTNVTASQVAALQHPAAELIGPQ